MDLVNKSAKLRAESKYDSALYLMQSLYDSAQIIGDNEFLARSALEISVIYGDTRKHDFALNWSSKAIEHSTDAGLDKFMMVATYNYGRALEDLGQPDSSLYYFRKVEKFQRDNADSFNLGITLSGIASIYQKRDDMKTAIAVSRESSMLYKAMGKYDYLAKRYFWIGEFYLVYHWQDGLDKTSYLLDSSEYFFAKSVAICDSLNYPDPKFKALRGLAVASQRRGDYQKALGYMYRSSDITQEFYSADVDGRILDLREKYNTANLELEAQQQRVRALEQERGKNITMFVAGGLLIIFSIWLYIIDQRRKNIKAIAAKNEELNRQRIDELLQQQEIASLQGVLEGQEQERKRVAIDLHDRLGGILSMVKLHFSAVEEKLPEGNPSKKKFLTASELLDLAAGEVRNISHNLLSGVLAKFGLMPALKDLTDRINESGEIKLNLIAHNVEGALNSEQELQAYRIVQELISNILKHSDAKEANIQLIRNDEEKKVNLIVEDDGKGFDPKAPSLSGGIGLSNLKARVNKLNGSFHIDSGKGAGTSVSIDIPIEDD